MTRNSTIERIARTFSPTGNLRASINLGNPILASKRPDGQPVGVSLDLARAFAHRVGLELELLVFDTAGKSVEAVAKEQADIGFFAVDPVRGAEIAFTAPYLLIEGVYMVRTDSLLHDNAEVDHAGTRVAVGKDSAYDLYLSRELKHASIVRAPTSPAVVNTLLAEEIEVAAGVKQQLEADAQRLKGLRLLPGRFMVIQQAMGLSKLRPQESSAFLFDFVEEMKSSGFIVDALRRHGIQGASVASAAMVTPISY